MTRNVGEAGQVVPTPDEPQKKKDVDTESWEKAKKRVEDKGEAEEKKGRKRSKKETGAELEEQESQVMDGPQNAANVSAWQQAMGIAPEEDDSVKGTGASTGRLGAARNVDASKMKAGSTVEADDSVNINVNEEEPLEESSAPPTEPEPELESETPSTPPPPPPPTEEPPEALPPPPEEAPAQPEPEAQEQPPQTPTPQGAEESFSYSSESEEEPNAPQQGQEPHETKGSDEPKKGDEKKGPHEQHGEMKAPPGLEPEKPHEGIEEPKKLPEEELKKPPEHDEKLAPGMAKESPDHETKHLEKPLHDEIKPPAHDAHHESKEVKQEGETVIPNVKPSEKKEHKSAPATPQSHELQEFGIEVVTKGEHDKRDQHHEHHESPEQKVEGAEQTMTPQSPMQPIPGALPAQEVEKAPPLMRLHPEALHLVEKMMKQITIESLKGVTKTTVEVSMPGSKLDGTKIVFERFETAPGTFHIQLFSTPQGQELINQNYDSLLETMQTFKGNFDYNMQRPVLLTEYHAVSRKGDDEGGGGGGQQHDDDDQQQKGKKKR
ncbi:MAG: hypothetical protein MRY21_06785 [Simkaniaceae bacterium]|nr:hypothetical protein [Simkaniaceae bacterium]